MAAQSQTETIARTTSRVSFRIMLEDDDRAQANEKLHGLFRLANKKGETSLTRRLLTHDVWLLEAPSFGDDLGAQLHWLHEQLEPLRDAVQSFRLKEGAHLGYFCAITVVGDSFTFKASPTELAFAAALDVGIDFSVVFLSVEEMSDPSLVSEGDPKFPETLHSDHVSVGLLAPSDGESTQAAFERLGLETSVFNRLRGKFLIGFVAEASTADLNRQLALLKGALDLRLSSSSTPLTDVAVYSLIKTTREWCSFRISATSLSISRYGWPFEFDLVLDSAHGG